MLLLPHVVHYVQCDGIALGGRHYEDFGCDLLLSKIENVGRLLAPSGNLFRSNVGKRLTGADGRAHWPFAYRCPVVTHIALHHLLLGFHHLRDSEGAGENAVAAGDAARLQGRMDDAVFILFDRIGGTDLGTGWLVTVPTDISGGCDALASFDEIEVNH